MLFSSRSGSLKDASLLPARDRFEPPGARPGPSSRPIHRSAWKGNSTNFVFTAFSEGRFSCIRMRSKRHVFFSADTMYSSRNKVRKILQRDALTRREGKTAFHGGRLRGALRGGARKACPSRPRCHIRARRDPARTPRRRRETLRAKGGTRPTLRYAPQRRGDHALSCGGGKHLRGDSRCCSGIGGGTGPSVGALFGVHPKDGDPRAAYRKKPCGGPSNSTHA